MESTDRLTGTIEEQVKTILDHRNEHMWLSGIVYDGDFLEIEATVGDVLEFRDVMDVPGDMDDDRLAMEVEWAADRWARSVGLEPYSRSDLVEEALGQIDAAEGSLWDIELDDLELLTGARDATSIGNMVSEALALLGEARRMVRDLK